MLIHSAQREIAMFSFQQFTHDGQAEPAYIRILDGGRLVGILRPPGHYAGESPKHWRVDCDEKEYEPVMKPEIRDAAARYLGHEKVHVYVHANWTWRVN
jgi:hypothetical protein